MFGRGRRLLLVFLISFGALPGPAPGAPDPRPPSGWEEALWWLPENTETLIVTQSPADVSKGQGESPKEGFDSIFVCGPLASTSLAPICLSLGGQKLRYAVWGSRRFRQPQDLGLMLYEGCHILRFGPDADEAIKKAFRACLQKAEKRIEVEGQSIAVYAGEPEADKWTIYISHPSPGVLICATDRDYLKDTLTRMARKPKARAFPADLPEWKHVDVNANRFGMRHYRREFANDDPTSPLNPRAGEDSSDPAATGLVFWTGAKDGKAVRVRYLTGAKDPWEKTAELRKQLAQGPKPRVAGVDAGVVEVAVSLANEEDEGLFYLGLLMYLGHAIFL